MPVSGLETFLTYPDKLAAFVDADEGIKGGNGILKVNLLDSDEGETWNSYKITFKARNTGAFKIKFSDDVHVYSFATGDELSVATSPATVQIKNDRLAGGDASLADIRIAGASLVPSFSKNIYEYSTVVESDVNRLVISADPSDESALVSVTGNDKLVFGLNTVKITVTAENGTKLEYEIFVTKKEKVVKEEEKKEEQNKSVKVSSGSAVNENSTKAALSDTVITDNTGTVVSQSSVDSYLNDESTTDNEDSQTVVKSVIIVLAVVIILLLIFSMIFFSKSRKE